MAEHEKNKNFKPGQNSPLRMWSAGCFQKAGVTLHDALPRLNPNTITTLGTIAVLSGGVLQEKANRSGSDSKVISASATALKMIGYVSDGLDGALARAINEKTPGKLTGSFGANYDLINDRMQEEGLAAMREESANQRRDGWGRLAAASVEFTTTLPSIVRADKNRRGIVVDEVGNPPAFLGSRPGRIALNTIGELFPSLQRYTDTIGTAANLYAVSYRLKTQKSEEQLDEKARKSAKKAEALLSTVALAATAHVIYKAMRR